MIFFWRSFIKRTRNFTSLIQNTLLNRPVSQILIVIRLSNFELFLVECDFNKKGKITLIPIEKLKDKQFASIFERVFFKKSKIVPSQNAISLLEKNIAEFAQEKSEISNLNMVIQFLTVLEIIPLAFAFNRPKFGCFNR